MKTQSNNNDDLEIKDNLKQKKFKIITVLYDNETNVNSLEKSVEQLITNSFPKGKEQFLDNIFMAKYITSLFEQFAEGKSNAIIQIDEKTQINIGTDKIYALINSYSVQSNKLIDAVLLDYNLKIDEDIIKIHYICKYFPKQFGELLVKEKNKQITDKFQCIDAFDKQNIFKFVSIYLLEFIKKDQYEQFRSKVIKVSQVLSEMNIKTSWS